MQSNFLSSWNFLSSRNLPVCFSNFESPSLHSAYDSSWNDINWCCYLSIAKALSCEISKLVFIFDPLMFFMEIQLTQCKKTPVSTAFKLFRLFIWVNMGKVEAPYAMILFRKHQTTNKLSQLVKKRLFFSYNNFGLCLALKENLYHTFWWAK